MRKIKVQEELEIPNKIKMNNYEEEIEKYKEMYYLTKRELERSKTEFSEYSIIQAREMAAKTNEMEIYIKNLHNKLQESELSNNSNNKEEIVRNQNLKIKELEHLIGILKQQAAESKTSKENSSFELSKNISESQKEFLNLRSKIIFLQTENTSLEAKLHNLSDQNEKKESAIKDLRRNLIEYQNLSESLNSKLKEKEQEILNSKDKFSLDLKENYLTLEKYKQEHEAFLIENSEKLNEREAMIKRLNKELSEIQKRYEISEKRVKVDFLLKIKDLKLKTDSLELALTDSKHHVISNKSKYEDDLKLKLKEIKCLESEVSRLQREKEVLLEKNRIIGFNEKEHNYHSSRLEKDLIKKLKVYENVEAEQKEKLSDMEHIIESYKNKENTMNSDLNLSLEKNRSILTQLETFQREAHSRYEELANTYRNKLLKYKEKSNKLLLKEKKKAEAYKQKALLIHEKNKALVALRGSSGTSRLLETNEIF